MLANEVLDNFTARSNSNAVDCSEKSSLEDILGVKILLALLYTTVLLLAIVGNFLVVYVVVVNRGMQTVTNLFIANLALSDMFVNITSVWLTPMYTYVGSWVFGEFLCHLFPLCQGSSIFISTLTLTAIALDRYIAIVHPLIARPTMRICATVIVGIWVLSAGLTIPYGVIMRYLLIECDILVCFEDWEQWNFAELRKGYGLVVIILQYGIPFATIGFCYAAVGFFLWKRPQLTARSAVRDAAILARKKRLVRMLMLMVVIFTVCWAPLNIVNVLRDNYPSLVETEHLTLIYLLTHLIAVSATCWNPFLYGFMNENFKREFTRILPFVRSHRGPVQSDISTPFMRDRLGTAPARLADNSNTESPRNYGKPMETIQLLDGERVKTECCYEAINQLSNIS